MSYGKIGPSNSTGLSSSNPRALSTGFPLIPSDLSFIFSVKQLRLNDDVPHVRDSRYFEPPTTSNAFSPGQLIQYRWCGGVATPIGTDGPFQPARLEPHLFNLATVFTQMPDTPHLLAVNFDAGAVNVSDITTWHNLSFRHVSGGNALGTYSSISVVGTHQHLAAPGAGHWITQLLPEVYDYRQRVDHTGQIIPPSTTSAGLIGDLPLLLALAAFSGPQTRLNQILTRSLRPGAWDPHMFIRDDEAERGMVVKVYLDPTNPAGSTRVRLNHLQNGQYGPFYGHGQ